MQVSIVVPAYNCSKYITRCIESVLAQTYDDWELLIIDDGSSDDTPLTCRSYIDKDARIKYYHQENQGQGIARNLGVKEANGEFIAFLDADDWWSSETLSILYQFAQTNQVDIVFFDYIIVENEKEEVIKRIDKAAVSLKTVTNTEEHPELLYLLKGSIWDKFYHRNVWEGIKQPGHPYEDTAVLPMVLTKAKRIGQIQIPLYYYREGRYDSTVNQQDTVFYMLDSMDDIKRYFKNHMIFEKYQEPLRKYNEWMYLVVKNHIQRLSGKDKTAGKYDELLKSSEKFIEETYPRHKLLFNLDYIVWGSYNLRSMLNRSQRNLRVPKYNYAFSSIISLMAPVGKVGIPANTNPYRNKMIHAEMNRELCNMSKNKYDSINYLCIDFLEERFPIVKVNENILTLSDALTETGVTSELLADPLSRDYVDMWKRSALSLIGFLKKQFKLEQIILVKNYLCEGYGRYGVEHLYPEVNCIRKQNLILEEYYVFFEKHYSGIKVITNDRTDLEFTDEEYPHGCYPWHQNEFLYYAIADKIEQYVIEDMKYKGI